MTDSRRHPRFRPRERGAVLFIALIMLLLLTLIGITAMQVTLLKERMAGGFRVQHQAFQQTEGTLKDTRKALNDAAMTSGPLYYSADATLTASNALPWATWLTTEPTISDPDTGLSQVNAHVAVGSPPAVLGARELRYFVVSALNEDPGGSGDAKSAVQAVFLY
jgi:type IV pilus assembly protein PilX